MGITLRMGLLRGGVLTALMLPGTGWSQQTAGNPIAAAGTAEIIVTAQRREQSLIDVPAAITAIGGDTVRNLNVTSMSAIAQQVPSFTVTYERGTNTTPTFNLRGIQGDGLSSRLNESSIAIYADDVYLGDENMLNGAVFDLRRVEVLRGPQGTLFGRNTTGGLVNFISETPTKDFSGFGSALYGSDNAVTLEGAVSGPLSSGVRARIAGTWDRNDGHYRNVYLGAGSNGVPRKLNARDIWSVRATIEADLGPDTLVRLTGLHTENHSETTPSYVLGTLKPGTTALPPYTRAQMCDLDQILSAKCISVVQVQGALPNSEPGPGLASAPRTAYELRAAGPTNFFTARLTHDFGGTTLTSITNYTSNRFFEGLETGRLSPSIVSTDSNLYTSRFNKADQFSAELRLNGSRSSFDWVIGGLFYTDKKYHHVFASIPGAPVLAMIDSSVKSHSFAIFGQLDNHLSDELTLSIGGRYTLDYRKLTQATTYNDVNKATSFQDILAYLKANGRPTNSSTKDFTGKLGLTWKPSDISSYYLSFSRGIKGAGFNAGFSPFIPIAANAAIAGPVGQEILDSFEAGAKNRLFDRRLSINSAVFLYNYQGKQISIPTFDPVLKTASFNYINVGTARVYGVETEISYRPSRYFDFTASGSVIGNKITKSNISTPDAFGVITPLQGKKLVSTPTWTFNAIPAFHLPTDTIGEFTLQSEINGLSRRNFSPTNDPLAEDKAHVFVNLRVLWQSPDERYNAQVFVTNLFEERQILDTRDTVLSALGVIPTQQNEGRLWGVKAGVRF